MTDKPVALITGSAKRVGAHLIKRLHDNGYNIILHYHRSKKEADNLTNQLNQKLPNSAYAIKANLTKHNDVIQLAQKAQQCWQRIDVLINNASSFYPTTFGQVTEQQWDDLNASNAKGAFFLTQRLSYSLKKNNGCVINIVDIYAKAPIKNYSAYCAAKAALLSLNKSLALELAPHIRVNGIAPGPVLWPEDDSRDSEAHTKFIQEQTALKREGSPQDIANTVLFLLHHANYMTGQTISVDGGRSLFL